MKRAEVLPIASLQLVFDVLAKDNASSTFRQVGDSADRAGKQAESGLSRVGGAAKMLGGALLGAGIISGFKSLFDAADESARISARTENVISQMGNAAKISATGVGDLAGAIAAKTGVDDEAIQSGQNLLLTFGNIRNEAGEGNDVFNQTSQLMVDMSRAMGKDASGSAIQLGKALNDPVKGITALSKAGVSFTEQQKEQIRTLVESGDILGAQKIILGELEKQFGGAAEAMGTPLDRAKIAVGNLAEALGGYLLPIVETAADGFLGLIEGFQTGETSADGFIGAMETAGAGIRGLIEGFQTGEKTADGFQGTMQTTGAVLADVAGAVADIAGVVGDVAGFFIDLPGPIQLGVAALGAFVYLKGPVSNLFETIALKAMYASEAIGTAATGGLRGAASGLLGAFGGPWGLAITGATIGLGFLIQALTSSGDATDESADQTAKATAAQKSFADAVRETNGVITDNLRQSAAKAAQDSGLLDIVAKTGRATTDVTDALLGNRGAYDNVKAGIEQYIQQQTLLSVGTGEAALQHGRNADAARTQLGELDRLVATYPSAVAAQDQLTTAVTGSTDTTAVYQAQLQATADSAKDVQDQTNLLKSALDALTGTNVSVDEATSAYYSALDQAKTSLGDLSGEVVANNGLLNLQSERGREVADRLTGLADNSNGYLSALIAQGASQADVAALDGQLRDSFFKTARQMTGNDDTARLLTDRYYGLPEERKTTVGVVDEATAPLGVIQSMLAGIKDKTVHLTVEQRITGGATVNSLGLNNIPPRAAGGPVWPKQTFLVGEKGPELVQFGTSGFVTPANKTRDILRPGTYSGGLLAPGYAPTAQQERGPMQVTLQLDPGAVTDLLDGRVVNVLETVIGRGAYNG